MPCLTDHLSRQQRLFQVVAARLGITAVDGGAECGPGQRSEDRRLGSVVAAVGVRELGVQVESTVGAIDQQSVGECAAYPGSLAAGPNPG